MGKWVTCLNTQQVGWSNSQTAYTQILPSVRSETQMLTNSNTQLFNCLHWNKSVFNVQVTLKCSLASRSERLRIQKISHNDRDWCGNRTWMGCHQSIAGNHTQHSHATPRVSFVWPILRLEETRTDTYSPWSVGSQGLVFSEEILKPLRFVWNEWDQPRVHHQTKMMVRIPVKMFRHHLQSINVGKRWRSAFLYCALLSRCH